MLRCYGYMDNDDALVIQHAMHFAPVILLARLSQSSVEDRSMRSFTNIMSSYHCRDGKQYDRQGGDKNGRTFSQNSGSEGIPLHHR